MLLSSARYYRTDAQYGSRSGVNEPIENNDPEIVTHFKATVNLGWKKLDHYYKLTDRAPAYVLVVFLHPHYKFRWFELKWKAREDWLNKVREVIRSAYMTPKRSTATIYLHGHRLYM